MLKKGKEKKKFISKGTNTKSVLANRSQNETKPSWVVYLNHKIGENTIIPYGFS